MMFDITDKKKTPVPFRLPTITTLAIFLLSFYVALADDKASTESTQTVVLSTLKNVECEGSHEKNNNYFGWPDYVVLGLMLVITCSIGTFYGFFAEKQETHSDFLHGGGSMGTFPMAMSLAASFVTAIELLGNPAEMYNNGSQFWMICLAFLLVVPITSKLYLPIFMSLRLTSSYEYLAKRFCTRTRHLASALYVLQMVLYTSVAVYAPALALSHVTGLNVYVAVTVVYVVCIFYASQGGMKAIIMTDTFQAAVLVASILLVLYLGEKYVGGVGVIWSESYKTERLEIFNMNPNPTIRHSFWSVVIGGTIYWVTMFCANQASIQKYLSVESISQARSALWFSAFALILIYTVNFYTGMVLVAHYRSCDPLKTKEIEASDEILPLYIISQLGHHKGITGFFVAGIFAASLGTVASALNSLSAVTLTDFIEGALKVQVDHTKGALWSKWISFVYGVISFGLVFVVEQLGSVMQVALSFNGMVGGVTLGLFSLGMFFPWANSKGAALGAIIALALVMVMGLGQQVAVANGAQLVELKETGVEKCPCFNSSAVYTQEAGSTDQNNSEPSWLFQISYLWYSTIGFLVTIIAGLIISGLTGFEDPKDVDADLLSPPVRNLLDSLPNNLKERLNIPLKQNHPHPKDIALKGVVNIAMDISDEKVEGNKKTELPSNGKII